MLSQVCLQVHIQYEYHNCIHSANSFLFSTSHSSKSMHSIKSYHYVFQSFKNSLPVEILVNICSIYLKSQQFAFQHFTHFTLHFHFSHLLFTLFYLNLHQAKTNRLELNGKSCSKFQFETHSTTHSCFLWLFFPNHLSAKSIDIRGHLSYGWGREKRNWLSAWMLPVVGVKFCIQTFSDVH